MIQKFGYRCTFLRESVDPASNFGCVDQAAFLCELSAKYRVRGNGRAVSTRRSTAGSTATNFAPSPVSSQSIETFVTLRMLSSNSADGRVEPFITARTSRGFVLSLNTMFEMLSNPKTSMIRPLMPRASGTISSLEKRFSPSSDVSHIRSSSGHRLFITLRSVPSFVEKQNFPPTSSGGIVRLITLAAHFFSVSKRQCMPQYNRRKNLRAKYKHDLCGAPEQLLRANVRKRLRIQATKPFFVVQVPEFQRIFQ
jgi:hypothetical protein